MVSRKAAVSKCEYHLCANKSPLRKCGLCGRLFCSEHIRPKAPSGFSGDMDIGFSKTSQRFEDIKHRDGHPCPEYPKFIKLKEEQDTLRRLKSLDEMRKVRETTPEPFEDEERPKKIRTYNVGSLDEILGRKVPSSKSLKYPSKSYNYDNTPPEPKHSNVGKYVVVTAIGIVIAIVLYNQGYLSFLPANLQSSINGGIFSVAHTLNIKLLNCSDGTFYNRCSFNKPYFCSTGTLTKNATFCGCGFDYDIVPYGEACTSRYSLNPKSVTLNYIQNGKQYSFDYIVYGGLNDYLAGIERSISYYSVPPTFKDFVLKNIDDPKQEKYISDFTKQIETLSNNPDDQARIAISIVQNIPYDYGTLKGRYAYQVLYDQNGVCGEKSPILVSVLRNLGYGTALIDYGNIEPGEYRVMVSSISHEAVGIKCPMQYSYKNTGYCFIETTKPSIITYSGGNYPLPGCISSDTSPLSCTEKLPDQYTLTVISDGKSFDSVATEYNDAQEWGRLESAGSVLDESNYNLWSSLAVKYGIFTQSELQANIVNTCQGQMCNGKCWMNCPAGFTFTCTSSGGVCQ